MRKYIISGIITATIIAVAGVIFYACNKEERNYTTADVQNNNAIHKDRWGYWTDPYEVAGRGADVDLNGHRIEMCYRYLIEKFYNYETKRWEEYKTVIYEGPCPLNDNPKPNFTFHAKILPAILNNPDALNNMDYADITNFALYVDDILVTPDFSREKLLDFEIVTDDGEVITFIREVHITYETIINLWEEIIAQGIW